jgi:hypothetical protein
LACEAGTLPLGQAQPFLLLVIFLRRSHIYAQAGLNHNRPIYTSYVAGMTGMCHHAQLLLVEMESHKAVAQAGITIQGARIIGMNYQACLVMTIDVDRIFTCS